MPNHRQDDDALPVDDQPPYVSTPADALRRAHYTLFPVLYTDEDSTTNDLLWQLVLEQRGTRYLVAIVCWTLMTLVVLTGVLVLVTL